MIMGDDGAAFCHKRHGIHKKLGRIMRRHFILERYVHDAKFAPRRIDVILCRQAEPVTD